MKTHISAQQLVHFRQQGHIHFSNFSFDWKKIEEIALQKKERRDLWRSDRYLQNLNERQLPPLVFELLKKDRLRLLTDVWIDTAFPSGPSQMKDLFCFQGALLIATFHAEGIDLFEPSSLVEKIPSPSYLVVYGMEETCFIERANDPHTAALKKMGYGYGDRLMNTFHPLLFKR